MKALRSDALDGQWTTIFQVKAVYNWGVSIVLAVFNEPLTQRFDIEPGNPAFTLAFLALAFVFGIGYWWVSIDPSKNHPIAALGVLGQLAVFLIITIYTVRGELPIIFLPAGLIDLAFAGLFAVFLWRNA